MTGPFKLLPVLLLALFTFYVSGDLIVSIDCGGPGYQVDSTNFMVWTPDNTLISNGVAQVVRSDSTIAVMNTLRVFSTRKKNCYSYPVSTAGGQQVLVRASFYYGNYDGLSSPPSFDLHFDGNFWTTVETSISEVIMHEATYVAKGSAVSVCVAQTKPDQVPFISALQISSVDSDFYNDVPASRAVFLNNRFSCGANETLRFPDDEYDRIWMPAKCGTKAVTTEAIYIDPTGPNKPPVGILQNAGTVDSTFNALFLGPVSPMNYIVMYFSEVSDLASTSQTRSFRIYESKTVGSGPVQPVISPPYGSVDVRNLTYYTLDSATNISLIETVDSDLPPLLNAIESFNISGVLTNGTDSNDVDALDLLQTTFDVLQGWFGDPCLPAPYCWDWLNCSNDATPRVTALYLDGFDLSGELPDISSMDALEIIDLHNNSLTGTIPSFLGTMPNLKQLNLADNQFSGNIPTTLSKNNKLKLTVTGNPSLCTSGKSCSSSPGTINSTPGGTPITKNKKSSTLPVVLGTTIPAFFLVWIAVGVFVILRRRGKPANTNMPGGGANGKIGEEMVHEFMGNVAQQSFGSPAPLFGNSGQSSDQDGQTGVQDP